MTSCKNVPRSEFSSYVTVYMMIVYDCDIRTNDGQLSKNDIPFFRSLELECVGNVCVLFYIDLTEGYTSSALIFLQDTWDSEERTHVRFFCRDLGQHKIADCPIFLGIQISLELHMIFIYIWYFQHPTLPPPIPNPSTYNPRCISSRTPSG